MRKPVNLQRRHFELIAETVRQLDDRTTRHHVAKAFAECLRATNPQFKPERFLDACGVNQPVRLLEAAE